MFLNLFLNSFLNPFLNLFLNVFKFVLNSFLNLFLNLFLNSFLNSFFNLRVAYTADDFQSSGVNRKIRLKVDRKMTGPRFTRTTVALWRSEFIIRSRLQIAVVDHGCRSQLQIVADHCRPQYRSQLQIIVDHSADHSCRPRCMFPANY